MKRTANEQIGKKKPNPTFILPAKQSKHLILFPNNCDDSRTCVTRNLMEQKFSVPLRGNKWAMWQLGPPPARSSRIRESHFNRLWLPRNESNLPQGKWNQQLLSRGIKKKSCSNDSLSGWSSKFNICKQNFNTLISNYSQAKMKLFLHQVTGGVLMDCTR